jgi:hypothetical protein
LQLRFFRSPVLEFLCFDFCCRLGLILQSPAVRLGLVKSDHDFCCLPLAFVISVACHWPSLCSAQREDRLLRARDFCLCCRCLWPLLLSLFSFLRSAFGRHFPFSSQRRLPVSFSFFLCVGAVFLFWCISCHRPGLRFSLLQAVQAGTSLRAWIQRPQGTS